MSEIEEMLAFARARLDEEHQAASTATAGPWRYNPNKYWRKPGTCWFEEAVFAGPAGDDAVCIAGTGETDDPQSMADAAHIARHDPSRVLADIEAKRLIIKQLEAVEWIPDDQDDDEPEYAYGWARGMSDALKLVILPWAGHPDYKPTWQSPDL